MAIGADERGGADVVRQPQPCRDRVFQQGFQRLRAAGEARRPDGSEHPQPEGQPRGRIAEMKPDRPAEGKEPPGQRAQHGERCERGRLFDREMPRIPPGCRGARIAGIDEIDGPAIPQQAPGAGGADEAAADDKGPLPSHGPSGFHLAYQALNRVQLVSA